MWHLPPGGGEQGHRGAAACPPLSRLAVTLLCTAGRIIWRRAANTCVSASAAGRRRRGHRALTPSGPVPLFRLDAALFSFFFLSASFLSWCIGAHQAVEQLVFFWVFATVCNIFPLRLSIFQKFRLLLTRDWKLLMLCFTCWAFSVSKKKTQTEWQMYWLINILTKLKLSFQVAILHTVLSFSSGQRFWKSQVILRPFFLSLWPVCSFDPWH